MKWKKRSLESNAIKLHTSTGTSTRTGSNFDAVGIVWQHRWGGGL